MYQIKMYRIGLLVLLGVAVASAGRSPNADLIDELFPQLAASRISSDVLEDAKLDVPGLILKYKYPLEIHEVVTSDGYILQMHRIPHGRDQNNQPGDRPIVFLMHGLLSSSADWVLIGPGCSLAYILAEEGFDVWMGNARGNFYSRKHLTLNPDAFLNTNFWKFSWDEIGNHDLPTMIDYALKTTGRKSLHYIGHSQGTTSFFVMTSLRPEYNEKIVSMHAFAPVAYMAHNNNILLNVISPFSSQIEKLTSMIGIGEFLPNNAIMSWAGYQFCMDDVVFQPLCSNILFLVAGWNEAQHNATLIPLKLAHTPAGAAARQFAHYAQGITHGEFRRYDLGSRTNRKTYGSRNPPKYDLSKIKAPVFLHYSDSDPLAHVNDVDRLFKELGNAVGKFRIGDSSFSHLDFIWGIDAKDLLFTRTINLIRAMENQQ